MYKLLYCIPVDCLEQSDVLVLGHIDDSLYVIVCVEYVGGEDGWWQEVIYYWEYCEELLLGWDGDGFGVFGSAGGWLDWGCGVV